MAKVWHDLGRIQREGAEGLGAEALALSPDEKRDYADERYNNADDKSEDGIHQPIEFCVELCVEALYGA